MFLKRRPSLFGSNKEQSPSSNIHSATALPDKTQRTSPFDDPFAQPLDDLKYGFQVSITGGIPKARKPSLAERAARFAGAAFGNETTPRTRPALSEAQEHRLLANPDMGGTQSRPGQYTAVKDVTDMSRDLSQLSNNSESSLKSVDSAQDRALRDSLASSVYSQADTNNRVQPLHMYGVNAKAPFSAAPPQLPPLDHAKHTASGNKEAGTRRWSNNSNNSTDTVTAAEEAKQMQSHFSWTTYTGTERNSTMSDDSNNDNPTSRFSWTTTGTGTTYQQDTPSTSPPAGSHSSIMSRRKPVPSRNVIGTRSYENLQHVKKSRKTEASKALPDRPKKMDEEADRVDELTARLNDLEMQKGNLEKLLAGMKKVESASPLEVTEKMRRENRKKMAEVEIRRDDMNREIFEVGRLLSRARAKAKQQDGVDSGIWLRRVTD